MSKRSRVVPPTVFAIVVATFAWGGGSALAEPGADDCLSKPNGTSPAGKHWFYRVDRTNNRRCWYLGPDGAKPRQAAAVKQRASRTSSAAATDKADSDVNQTDGAQSSANQSKVTDASRTWSALTAPAAAPERQPVSTGNDGAAPQAAADAEEQTTVLPPAPAGADRAAEESPTAAPVMAEPTLDPAALKRSVEARAAPAGSPAPSGGFMLAVAAGALLLVAIIFRTIYKLVAVGQRRSHASGGRKQSSPKARRPRRVVAPPLAAAMGPNGQPSEGGLTLGARHWADTAHHASSAGLLDAVLQRVQGGVQDREPPRDRAAPAPPAWLRQQRA